MVYIFLARFNVTAHTVMTGECMQNCFYINGSVPPQGSKVMTKSVMRTVRGKNAMFALLQSENSDCGDNVASFRLADILKKSQDKLTAINPERHNMAMDDFLIDANGEMSSYASANHFPEYGACAAVLTVNNGVATATGVGDVSCFYYREKEFKRLTQRKEISATSYEIKDTVIGGEISGLNPKHFFSEKIDVEMDDVFLLCSSGVTDYVSDDRISYILSLNLTDERTVQRIVGEAIAKNADKDITVVLIRNGGKPIRSKRLVKTAIAASAAVILLAVLTALFSSVIGHIFKKPDILEEPTNTVITKSSSENEFIHKEDPSNPIPPEPYVEPLEEDEEFSGDDGQTDEAEQTAEYTE